MAAFVAKQMLGSKMNAVKGISHKPAAIILYYQYKYKGRDDFEKKFGPDLFVPKRFTWKTTSNSIGNVHSLQSGNACSHIKGLCFKSFPIHTRMLFS